MKKIKEYFASMSETVSMTRKEQTLALVLAMLAGCILGMLISPRKSICCGNGNGTQNYYGPAGLDEPDGQ